MASIAAASERLIISETGLEISFSGPGNVVIDLVSCLAIPTCLLHGHFAPSQLSVPRLQESCPAALPANRIPRGRSQMRAWGSGAHGCPSDTPQGAFSAPDRRIRRYGWPKSQSLAENQ